MKMRNYVFVLACLSLFACALANNLILGRRLRGDEVLQDRVVFKPGVPGIHQIATINATAPAGKLISYVSITSINPRVVLIKPIRGFIGTPKVLAVAVGKLSWPVNLKVLVYGVPCPNSPTTPAPTEPTATEPSSTETSSTEETSTEPESTEASSTASTSTEPSSTVPSSTEETSTEPESTEASSTGSTSTEPSSTVPSSTEEGSTEPENNETSNTEPDATEETSTEPESTEATIPTSSK